MTFPVPPGSNAPEVKPLLTLGNFYGPLDVMIHLSVTIGIILALPIILLIFWGFITPALSRKVANLGKIIVGSSSFLFWSGVYFCWRFVFPISIEYMLIGILPEGTMPWIPLEKYYSFLLMMHAGLGMLFQLPLLFVILGAIGILTLEWHLKVWKYMLVGLTILAAILTPPDVVSQVLFMIPLSVLYGLALIIIWFIEKGKRIAANTD
jgi:sec-independent protein translocase protein TatC